MILVRRVDLLLGQTSVGVLAERCDVMAERCVFPAYPIDIDVHRLFSDRLIATIAHVTHLLLSDSVQDLLLPHEVCVSTGCIRVLIVQIVAVCGSHVLPRIFHVQVPGKVALENVFILRNDLKTTTFRLHRAELV